MPRRNPQTIIYNTKTTSTNKQNNKIISRFLSRTNGHHDKFLRYLRPFKTYNIHRYFRLKNRYLNLFTQYQRNLARQILKKNKLKKSNKRAGYWKIFENFPPNRFPNMLPTYQKLRNVERSSNPNIRGQWENPDTKPICVRIPYTREGTNNNTIRTKTNSIRTNKNSIRTNKNSTRTNKTSIRTNNNLIRTNTSLKHKLARLNHL